MNKQREQAEALIYSVLDKVEHGTVNSDYYKKLFANMNDDEFKQFCERRLPFRFHIEAFKIEPKLSDIVDTFKLLDVPLLEKVKLPYMYKNKDGVPVESKEALVIYIHIKRMKQMLTKKNNTAMNIDKRDMKTGLLLQDDKGGKETDREFESLAVMGLDYTMDEFARSRADAMNAKAQMTNTILTKGYVSNDDIDLLKTDSLAKNLMNVYLLGAHIHSNLVDVDYMTPYTAKNKNNKVKKFDDF